MIHHKKFTLMPENDMVSLLPETEISGVTAHVHALLADIPEDHFEKQVACGNYAATLVQFEGVPVYRLIWQLTFGGSNLNVVFAQSLKALKNDSQILHVALKKLGVKFGVKNITFSTARKGLVESAKTVGYKVYGVWCKYTLTDEDLFPPQQQEQQQAQSGPETSTSSTNTPVANQQTTADSGTAIGAQANSGKGSIQANATALDGSLSLGGSTNTGKGTQNVSTTVNVTSLDLPVVQSAQQIADTSLADTTGLADNALLATATTAANALDVTGQVSETAVNASRQTASDAIAGNTALAGAVIAGNNTTLASALGFGAETVAANTNLTKAVIAGDNTTLASALGFGAEAVNDNSALAASAINAVATTAQQGQVEAQQSVGLLAAALGETYAPQSAGTDAALLNADAPGTVSPAGGKSGTDWGTVALVGAAGLSGLVFLITKGKAT